MMKKVGMILYMAAGAALLISGFATMPRGLKDNDRLLLEKVDSDYKAIGDIGFNGFCPLDYNIAFSNGEKDLVVKYDDGDYESYTRKAVYSGLVGSVYQNEDSFEVVVPECDTWSTLSNINGQELSAVIWHESFHAYQNTYFGILENLGEGVISEIELAKIIDSDSQVKNLFEKKLQTLEEALKKENIDDLRKISEEYVNISDKRDMLLGDDEKKSEDFYEMIEGTAYYVEAAATRYESGEEAFRKGYMDTAYTYAEGNAKYYRLGMLECMLLDKLDPDWKTSYSFDKPLEEVIAQNIF